MTLCLLCIPLNKICHFSHSLLYPLHALGHCRDFLLLLTSPALSEIIQRSSYAASIQHLEWRESCGLLWHFMIGKQEVRSCTQRTACTAACYFDLRLDRFADLALVIVLNRDCYFPGHFLVIPGPRTSSTTFSQVR